MDATYKEKWLEALRSGNYEQGKGFLKNWDKYCCLGVLCSIHPDTVADGSGFVIKGERGYHDTYLPDTIAENLGLDENTLDNLVDMNDEEGKTFSEIADWIEVNL